MAHCNLVGGSIVASVYFYTAEGWSASKCSLTRHLVETLQALQHPWVIAGDFNVEPEELMQAQELMEPGAVVVALEEATHEQGGKLRKLSYFVVHKALATRV